MKVYLPVGDEVVLDGVVGGGVGLGQLPCREPPGRDRDVPAVRWSVHRADRAKLLLLRVRRAELDRERFERRVVAVQEQERSGGEMN